MRAIRCIFGRIASRSAQGYHPVDSGSRSGTMSKNSSAERNDYYLMKSLTLTTKRLLLRGFAKKDWQSVHEYASDPEVVRYLSWGPNTEEETRDLVRRATVRHLQQPQQNYEFVVVLKAKDKLIGHSDCVAISSKKCSLI